jgi:hypothetical protein
MRVFSDITDRVDIGVDGVVDVVVEREAAERPGVVFSADVNVLDFLREERDGGAGGATRGGCHG